MPPTSLLSLDFQLPFLLTKGLSKNKKGFLQSDWQCRWEVWGLLGNVTT